MADDQDIQDGGAESPQDSPAGDEQDVQRPDEQDNIVTNSLDRRDEDPELREMSDD